MLDPMPVAVDLTSNGRLVHLLDLTGDGSGRAFADGPVIDRANGHHLGGGPGQERFIGRVQVRTQNVGELHLDAQDPGQ